MRARLLFVVALLATMLAAPATADAARRKVPPRFFGAMWDKDIRAAPERVQAKQFASMAVNGVESARVVFAWRLAQSVPGVTDHSRTDLVVRNAARHGIDVLPIVMYAPRWARVSPDEEGSAPSNVAAYVDYLELLIARYGPGGRFWKENPNLPRRPIRAWQIWNEPHIEYQWTPQANWEVRYGELLRAAYPAVKRADPGAKVVLAGLANASWDLLERLYRHGEIKGSFDVMGVHYYEKRSHEFVEVSRLVRSVLRRNGDRRLPIWWTEAGASASAGRFDAPGHRHFQTTPRGMARHLTRTYNYLVRHRARLRIGRVYWYTWASSYSRNGGVFEFSGLNRFDGKKIAAQPALAAYRSAARRYEGCRKNTRARCVRR